MTSAGLTESTVEKLDVLILTAVKEEYDAVLQVAEGALAGSTWEVRPGPTGLDVARLLRHAGVLPSRFQPPKARLTVPEVFAFWHAME